MATIHVIQTAQSTTDRLTQKPDLTWGPDRELSIHSIWVDPSKRFQVLEGFGGAFTEAAAVTLHKLPPEQQAEILNAYFDPETGHGYSLCRTHINSCDFSLGNYAYDEVDGDVDLAHFSIDHDRQALLPMIQAAFKAAGGPVKLLASPWSPPAWMKTNGQMNHGGKLKPEYREAWARYYCRYVQEYQKEGVPIWGLSVQNEPAATQTWDSCVYTAEEERDFVRDYLGPALHHDGLAHIRLLIWDHNRDLMVERASVVFDDAAAAQYVWGTAFHWYVGDHFENVQILHDAYPDKQLVFTEGCQEGGPHIGSWKVGERYARSMINDLNHWTSGWIDWNMVLDELGGPNHVKNYCSAPILVDTQAKRVLYQSSYYAMGHFARYLRPGAERVLCATTADELEVTAALNTDNQVAVVVFNQTSETIPFCLRYDGQAAVTESLGHSIMTLCFPATP